MLPTLRLRVYTCGFPDRSLQIVSSREDIAIRLETGILTINMKNRPKLIILITASFILLLTAFAIRYSLCRIDNDLPRIEVVRGSSGIKDINIAVTLSRIKKEIAPIIIEDFLSQTKIATIDNGGLKLVDFKEKSVLARYGFEKGDIVKEVNGQKVNSVEKAIEICEVLEKEVLKNSDAKEISVVLNRGGEDVNINFRIPKFIPEKVSYVMTLEKQINKKGRN
ncbi:MAG: S1C family serine protease [Candidatus Omnitrophica bacterium]|nr:S1C family serine protease [Candidatus Omnitrophota bacterium]